MKHKFGFKSLTSKVSSQPAPEEKKKKDSSHSSKKPTSSKTIGSPVPLFIRQELPPHILTELRLACALLLQETGPSDEDYTVHINQPDPLEVYQRDQRDIKNIREQASASQTSLTLFPNSKSTKHRDSKALKEKPSAANKQSKSHSHANQSAKPATKAPEPAAEYPQRTSSNFQPHAPVNNSRSKHSSRKTAEGSHTATKPAPLESARPGQHHGNSSHRQSGRSGNSSRTTSHTATTMDGARVSTGVSSFTHPQADERRSRSGYSHELNNTFAEPQSRTWSLQNSSVPGGHSRDLQTDNPDYAVIPTLHPTFPRPASRQSHQEEPPRPASRAGSIFENIKDSFRDYVKPRPSMISTRIQSRTESRSGSRSESRASSRPPSRGSSFTSGKSWLRNASNGLRRKGSWSSFRSNKGGDEEEERGRSDARPDLNRSLPPLPGLDQYKEPKIHIAHLMAQASQIQATATNHHMDTASPVQPRVQTPTTQPLQPASPLSPPLSQRSASKPRIPFADDESDPALVPQPQNIPREARWLEAEVQRRLNSQLSPALSNDKSQGRASPAQSEAERRREEAIRQIARRPLPHDRSDSYRSQNSEARSLSALGFRERSGQQTQPPVPLQTAYAMPSTRERDQHREKRSHGHETRGRRENVEHDPAFDPHEEHADPTLGARRATDGTGQEKKGLRNRLSKLLGNHGNQPRAVVAN